MVAPKITDHVERALSRTATDLRGSEFELLVRAFAPRAQVIEDVLYPLLDALRDPASAAGFMLDLLGALVGAEERGALSDADYRTRVDAAIERNRSWATPEDALRTLLAFFPFLSVDAGGPGVDVFDANEPLGGKACAWLRPKSVDAADNYEAITPAEAEELMRYLARTTSTRVVFSYAASPRDGADTGFRFDDSGNLFDAVPMWYSSVDQDTRN